MWLRSLLTELGFAPSRSIKLYGDNQASIAIAHNPVGHTRAKQIDIRFHYLRGLVYLLALFHCMLETFSIILLPHPFHVV
jgi:hypothetical protein